MGIVNYDDAETTMRTVAEILGAHVGRIPDGEAGKRFHWIMFQPDVLGEVDGIERVGAEPIPFDAGLDARPLRIADGVEASEIALPPLGYANAARESYPLFTRLREECVIRAGTRFQVSLPTPVAVISSFFSGDDRIAIEPVYADALLGELEEIPHEDLAVQWDVASEMGILEGASGCGAVMQGWWTGGALEGSSPGSLRSWTPSPWRWRSACTSAAAMPGRSTSSSPPTPRTSSGSRTPSSAPSAAPRCAAPLNAPARRRIPDTPDAPG